MLPLIHPDKNVTIIAADEPGAGGAHHLYKVGVLGQEESSTGADGSLVTKRPVVHASALQFQAGGVQDVGANGLTNESLLEIVRHRLSCFQHGPFPCPENDSAHDHVVRALTMLYRRTAKRKKRGVEGVAAP